MRHKIANRILGRTRQHRQSLLKNLSSDLLTHGKIVTTHAKAQEVRRYLEPLITEAKQELTLHRRRNLQRKVLSYQDIDRLVTIAKANQDRPGGYLRLTKLASRRHDSAELTQIALVDYPVQTE